MPRPSGIPSALAASALTLALALAALAVATDLPLMMVHHAGLRALLADFAVDLSLASLLAVLGAAPLALAVSGLVRARGVRKSWLLIGVAPGAAVALFLTDALYRPHTAPYVIVALGFGAALAAMAAAVTLLRPRLANLVLFICGGGAFAGELLATGLDREMQDLLALLAACAAVAALRPLRRRLLRARAAPLLVLLAAANGAALLVVRHVDAWTPGWRPLSWQYAHWEPRLGRTLRALIDFDNDGYSPIAWGGDCDDFDANRNPAAHDHDGIDANCNGTIKPLHPSDEDRGLLPPAGEAAAPEGAVDLVVLITIDCMRFDTFTPQVTPRLVQLSQSGLALTRVYAAASDTIKSLPLLLRGSDGAPPIGERLARHGIPSAALFATHNPRIEPVVAPGFSKQSPTTKEERWSAAELTDRALAALPARGLLWLHYYDAHLPYPRKETLHAPPGHPAEMGRYLTALNDIDREIGRLEDHLRSSGRWQKTLLIVTGDHGESFGEHGVPYHGLLTYEAVSHVPGLVAGGIVQPKRVNAVLSHRDLPSTILGAFGFVEAEDFGRSWLRLRTSPALHRFVVVRSASGVGASHPMAALVEGELKLIVTLENDLVELYRPEEDPDERIDLRAPLVEEAARLEKELALFRDIDGYP
jgi:hypothetical protein